MNLQKLFEMQKVLDERIVLEKGLEGRDTLPEKILALQVELGECANEWRGFKFWSEDREPRKFAPECKCPNCMGFHQTYPENPLLEEYVDCLHFILSIGLYPDAEHTSDWFVESNVQIFKYKSIAEQFIYLKTHIGQLYQGEYDYDELFYEFLGLGEMLGFTWEQIEAAYYTKNEINHVRQAEGY